MLSQRIGITSKALLSLVGACMVKFSTSVISTWGNINLYILSYFWHQGENITESTNPTILLLTVFPMIIATLFATKLSNKFGYEQTIRVCALVFMLSPLIAAIWFKFYVFVVFCVIIPASSFAIIAIPILNRMWALFP